MPSIRGLASPHLTVLAALVLFVLVFAAREAHGNAGDAVAVLYAFPVTLLALRFGLAGGLAAALLAAVLTFVGSHDGLEVSAVGYATRFSVLFGVGAMVGWFTDRARSLQRQRKDGQRKLARFFDLSQDMLSTLGPDGHFDDLNPAWEATLGYTEHEIRSMPFIELVHPDDRARTETEAAGLAAGDTTVGFENRYLAKDGSIRWLSWSSRLDSADGLIYGRATDVTDRREAEEVFRGLIEAAPDAMVTVDATGMIELINSRAEEMFGYPREDLIGRQVEAILPHGVRSHIEPWLRLDADSGDARVALDASGRRRSGRGFPVEERRRSADV